MWRPPATKIFYGWWVVLAAAVGLQLSIAPIVIFTLGVFLKPLSQEFNWSRGEISFAFTLSTAVSSFVMPLVGRLVDRQGARRIAVPSLLLFGASVASLSFLTASLEQATETAIRRFASQEANVLARQGLELLQWKPSDSAVR